VDFGDRAQDARTGRLGYAVDALFKKFPNQSPYSFAGNNPIMFIDAQGNIKLRYDAEELKKNGVTQLGIQRFENIVKNIENLVKDNPDVLDALMNTTGFSKERLLKEMKYGEGPTLDITDYSPGARAGASGIVFDYSIVKRLGEVKFEDVERLSSVVLADALTILHEYGHYGDQVTNMADGRGRNSGQRSDGRNFDADTKFDPDAVKLGKQKWKVSITGHRGTDVEIMGFGVTRGELNQNGDERIVPVHSINATGVRQPPQELPDNAKEEEILKTLSIHR
jgi:hypothetical protein